jgi:hypothetical protein
MVCRTSSRLTSQSPIRLLFHLLLLYSVYVAYTSPEAV